MKCPRVLPHVAIASFLACGHLPAVVPVYEAFDYPALDPLTDQDGGSGWWAGWFGDGQSAPVAVGAEGLAYTDALGNQLHVAGLAADTTAAETSRIFRYLEELGVNNVWVSFLWRLEESNSLFEGVTFYAGSQEVFAVRNPSTVTSPEIHLGPPLTATSTGRGTFGVTHLVVLRLQKGAGAGGADLVEIFVDPLLTGTPSPPQASISGANFDFDTVRIAAQNGAPLHFDEFRLGPTFASVTPHDPAPETDSDGDGLTDAQEGLLGTDPEVPDTELFAAIRANPQFFGLHDAESILQQGQGGVIIPKGDEPEVEFKLEIQRSEDLLVWPEIETIERSYELPAGKNFLRVTLDP